ncbi:MAG TPA: heparan-alpha-glucosaminide N-acetyltransferase domain-containing protein [Candidatus Limnocylindria bacterium]|nr:heparan-alpha-glucosaminide N-acetyltransferase domain-containing protein [Candidatus Limnocylindria bacterium]
MAGERLGYLDALRGLALVLMVVNHTARFWIGREMGWTRYHLIYLTTSVAGPIFLFMVGFVLPMSFDAAKRPGIKYARRALGIVAAGYLLNVLVFPEDSWIASNVLHTIGLAILFATPLLYVMHRRAVRYAIVVGAVVLYATFSQLFAPLTGWVERHPRLAEVWFYDFPLWPWMSLVLVGLVLGWGARARPDERERARYFAVLAVAGAVCLAVAVAWEVATPGRPHLGFTRDYILNHHWIPSGATAAGVLGVLFCSLAAMYYLMTVRGYRFRPLVIAGQTAFMLYFVHHFIVVSLVQRQLGIVMTSWWVYWLANALLMAALIALAAAWLAVKRAQRDRATVDASAAA